MLAPSRPTTSGWSRSCRPLLCPRRTSSTRKAATPTYLEPARDSLASCLDLLGKGAVDAAQRAKQTAEVEAGKASALVDTVIAARDFVLKEVVVAIAKLKKLRDEIPAADTAVTTLKPNS